MAQKKISRGMAEEALLVGSYRAPTKTYISTTANALTSNLGNGFYEFRANVGFWFHMSNGTTNVTTENGAFHPADWPKFMPVDGDGGRNVAAVTAADAGYLDITKLGRA